MQQTKIYISKRMNRVPAVRGDSRSAKSRGVAAVATSRVVLVVDRGQQAAWWVQRASWVDPNPQCGRERKDLQRRMRALKAIGEQVSGSTTRVKPSLRESVTKYRITGHGAGLSWNRTHFSVIRRP